MLTEFWGKRLEVTSVGKRVRDEHDVTALGHTRSHSFKSSKELVTKLLADFVHNGWLVD